MEPPDERAPSEATEQPSAAPVSAAEHVPDPEARYSELIAQAFRYYDREEFEAAREACRDALDLKPDAAEAHALLSTIYEHLGDIPKAIEERERVVELSPNSFADREKLAALRAGIAQVGGRRRIVSPRLPAPTFWDTPWGAAVAAVATALVVLIVGYGILAYRESRTPPNGKTGAPAPAVSGTIPGTVSSPAPPAAPAPAQPTAPQQPPMQPQQQPAQARTPEPPPSQAVSPLPITPQTPPLEARTRESQPPSANGGFFDPSQPAPGQGSPTPQQPSGSTANPGPGRIEIVVAPRPGGSELPSPNAPSTTTPQMESRNNAAIAQNLQLAGRYREAAQAWERALAGAGDDAPRYHQNAALCYHRTGDKANARRHYSEAIRLYRDRIAAGGDREAAEQGIRACEAGLKLTQ